MRAGRDASHFLGPDVPEIALLVLGVECLETLPRQGSVEDLERTWPVRSLIYGVSLVHEDADDAAERVWWGLSVGVRLFENLHQGPGRPDSAAGAVVRIVCVSITKEACDVAAAAVDEEGIGLALRDANHLRDLVNRTILPLHSRLSLELPSSLAHVSQVV
jgi:hypothetical protein